MENLPSLTTIRLDSKHNLPPSAQHRSRVHKVSPTLSNHVVGAALQFDSKDSLPPKARHRSRIQHDGLVAASGGGVALPSVADLMPPSGYDDHQSAAMREIVQRRFVILLIWVIVMMGLSIAVVSQLYDGAPLPILNNNAAETGPEVVEVVSTAPVNNGIISPVFSREVQHWAPQIQEWSRMYGVDANQIATIMQIESCGDPYAESWVGAQGLFQVMPFHFEAHENMKDPDTNARRGINYFLGRLDQTNGDVGRSFAGYNGGHGAAGSPYDTWPEETKHYFYWATGIYEDAVAGKQISERLDEWMAAGGYSLCTQASQSLGLR